MHDLPISPRPGGHGDPRILSICPMCQTTYHPLKTRVVAERDDAHLLYLECRHCGSAVMALVTAGQTGLESVGTVTDLTRGELAQAASETVVTIDDVVDLVEWFNNSHPNNFIFRRE